MRRGGRRAGRAARRAARRLLLAAQPGRAGRAPASARACASPTCSSPAARCPSRCRTRCALLKSAALLETAIAVGACFDGDVAGASTSPRRSPGRRRRASTSSSAGSAPASSAPARALGHGGLAAADAANAAARARRSRRSSPSAYSDGDPRERHRGVSHHTRVGARAVLGDRDVAWPAGLEPRRWLGEVVEVDVDGLARSVRGPAARAHGPRAGRRPVVLRRRASPPGRARALARSRRRDGGAAPRPGRRSRHVRARSLDDARLATEVVDAALEAGTTVFDSSPMYGAAEASLGAALGGRRGRGVVATKIWADSVEEGRAQYAAQLRCFGRVEIEQVHNLVAWREHLPLARGGARRGPDRPPRRHALRSQAAFGELERAMRTGRFDTVQIPLNPLERECEARILPLAEELGLAVIVMRPLGGARDTALRPGPPRRRSRRCGRSASRPGRRRCSSGVSRIRRVDLVIPATSRPERAAENAAAGCRPRRFGPDERGSSSRLGRAPEADGAHAPASRIVVVPVSSRRDADRRRQGDQAARVSRRSHARRGARARPARPRGRRREGRRASGRASPTTPTSPSAPGSLPSTTSGASAELLLKVKEPIAEEYAAASRGPDALHVPPHRRRRAADARARRVRDHGRSPTRRSRRADRQLPLLAPMSEVAGRLAAQMGA